MEKIKWVLLVLILVLSACSEEEEGRKSISEYDYNRLLYFYPNFEEQQFINYSIDSKILLSEDVTWSDVLKGYEYQLKIAEDYNEKYAEVQNDYYKGIIKGEEIHEASMALLALSGLLNYTVILPIDASPELKDIAESMNKTLQDMKIYVFSNYELVFDDDERVKEINESYDFSYNEFRQDFDELKEDYKSQLNNLREVINERE